MVNNIAVLTADISKSRKVEDRGKLQVNLLEVIEEINRKYKDKLLAEFTITLGDEFQGAIKEIEYSYEISSNFQELLYPVKIRSGIGIGNIETPLSKKVTEMDGPAFHRSRKALERAKKERVDIIIISGNRDADRTINIISRLLEVLKNKWTERQREILRLLKEKGGTLKEIGEEAGISKQRVSKIIESTHWREIEKAETEVKRLLGQL